MKFWLHKNIFFLKKTKKEQKKRGFTSQDTGIDIDREIFDI